MYQNIREHTFWIHAEIYKCPRLEPVRGLRDSEEGSTKSKESALISNLKTGEGILKMSVMSVGGRPAFCQLERLFPKSPAGSHPILPESPSNLQPEGD